MFTVEDAVGIAAVVAELLFTNPAQRNKDKQTNKHMTSVQSGSLAC